jgi:hypothetical protein
VKTARRTVILLTGVMMGLVVAQAQSLLDARAVGIGAYFPAVSDARDFALNPAGLVGIRDWDLNVSTYLTPSSEPVGFVFHGIAVGKRFLGDEAVAFRFAPGSSVRFVIPPVVTIGNATTPASNDREITYDENFALAYAHRFSKTLSAGIGARVRREAVSDTRYQIITRDTISYPTATRTEYSANSWLVDASVMWQPLSQLTVSAAARNGLWWRTGDTGSPIEEYLLPTKVIGEFGAAYTPFPRTLLVASAATTGAGALGIEWSAPFGLAVRGGVLCDSRQSRLVDALTVGIGWTYEHFEVDAGYLYFTKKSAHSGSGTSASFDPGLLTNLDVHAYSRNRLELSVKAAFGTLRESLARIEGVTIYGSIYPASAEMLANKPVGIVRVRNISSQPINAKVSLFVDRIMDGPTESPAAYVAPGAEAELPLMAVFNEQVKKVTALTVREGDVYVNATPAEQYDDKSQTRLVILGRNAWDGDSKSLRYFVTPDDPAILRYSRDVLLEHRDSLANVPAFLERFAKARVLINSFAGKLLYVNDPRLSADFVQYPSETLQLRGGDCDDMTVCFTSLLSSIGLSTAFVDVVPPEHPEKSHIYLLCDTGVEPRYGASIAGNPKRYIVRRNAAGVETIWIPLETTVAARGFDEAWTNGAQEYFDDVEVGLGLVKGWVRIVDVN